MVRKIDGSCQRGDGIDDPDLGVCIDRLFEVLEDLVKSRRPGGKLPPKLHVEIRLNLGIVRNRHRPAHPIALRVLGDVHAHVRHLEDRLVCGPVLRVNGNAKTGRHVASCQ